MNRAEYLRSIEENLYQGEVLGEAVFARFLACEKDPLRRYQWASLLQLESETKVRLRPFLARLELSIADTDVKERADGFAANYATTQWNDHMKTLIDVTDYYLGKFREVAAFAPDSDRDVTQSMIVHEQAIQDFARAELAGNRRTSIDAVVAQLRFPIAKPE
jgi:hypothetical protein